MEKPTKHTEGRSLSEEVKILIRQQKDNWPLVKNNFSGLEKVESKKIHFDDFKIVAQFNPERIRSSAAKTDTKSIQQRACFLCEKNRPDEQLGIIFKGKYTILVNPYSIFPEHLTIPLNVHTPQAIQSYFVDMLELSKELQDFTFFYNGPKCGASAPDHFHFQAGTKNRMPADSEAKIIAKKYGQVIFEKANLKLTLVDGPYMRRFILIQSDHLEELEKHFFKIYGLLPVRKDETEPMMNILCSYKNGWQVIIFPRDKQRPRQYFAEGDEQIIMSPASAEMGGLIILPRERDFETITKKDLQSIYQQVTINDESFVHLKAELRNKL